MQMKVNLDRTHIRNFLTLRYNPLQNTTRSLANAKGFSTGNSDPDGKLVEKLLLASVNKLTKNKKDVITVSLSSGIDSSLCLALLRKQFPEQKIVSICGVFDKKQDESGRAKEIARKFNSDFKILRIPSLYTNMPELISMTKKPRWNTYTHFVANEAKKYGALLVTGDGADELFAGYTFRYKKFLHLLKPDDTWLSKAKKYLECHNRDWVPNQKLLFDKSIKFNWKTIYSYLKPYFQNKMHPLNQVLLADYNGKLSYDFIPTSNYILKHYSISGGPIFLDKKIISFAMGLPLDQKYNIIQNQGKLILRKLSKRYGVKHIDEKKGFSPDLFSDWKKTGKSICESYIMKSDSRIYEKKIINPNWVLMAFKKIETDNDIRYLTKLVSVLALEIWLRVFITKELTAKNKL
tara:strand:- start:413 stop:1630 length:1218 start_codon:yes stop_codon:yes gene_type:complete